jgi:hypothetical protein
MKNKRECGEIATIPFDEEQPWFSTATGLHPTSRVRLLRNLPDASLLLGTRWIAQEEAALIDLPVDYRSA